MNPQELQTMLAELMKAINLVLQSGEPMSDEFQGLLAQTLETLVNAIDQMGGQPVTNLTPTTSEPPIEQGMPSSNVEGFAYDKNTGRLFVRFLGKHPNRNGPIYQYEGVPRRIFELFQKGAVPARTDGKNKWGRWWKGKVPSIGASLYTLIKTQNYPYQRVA